MKHLHKFRDSNEMNAKMLKKRKMEQAFEVEMKKLEIADKIATLLVRENDGETFKAW